jgi:hypothetical protein
MSTTTLPPVGSAWINKKDPHDIVLVTGHMSIMARTNKNNVIKIHRLNTNQHDYAIQGMFTWHYKPLEQGEQQ